MPVDTGQVTGQGRGSHEHQVADRRTVTQLPDAVAAREVIDHQTRGEGNDHAGPDAQQAAHGDQAGHAPGEEARQSGGKEEGQPDGQRPELVATDREAARKQDKGNDEQRRQRGEHLDLEVGCMGGKIRFQISQNGGIRPGRGAT